jgi:antitoxin component of MazEF toxin-antitoxin module
MENLIKIKSDAGVQLTDRELSVRWWGRRTVEEKQAILKEYLPSHNIENIDYESMYWVWLKQQKL